ncbi:hypothetical protein LGR16_001808 [Escherichia coli O157]|nr:hypothetical protein [Escherichia coli]EIF3301174.1 hypothetical protein [Escherichia coli O157]EIF3495985.1 hypothetical protein [Escherichia coli O157]EII1050039.1 hypothetical protein [Escherichia coli O157]EII1178935.1 hypothetical protein [Escherichia coli O157]
MSIVESIVKAVNDNIDHPRISTMIDIIKQEKTPGSYIRFTRLDSSDLLFTVKTEVHEQRIIVEVLVKENKELDWHSVRGDRDARNLLKEHLCKMEEKYNIPFSLEVNLFPAYLLWYVSSEKHVETTTDVKE